MAGRSYSEIILSHGENNDITEFPYWIIADRTEHGEIILRAGIWFNREDAEAYLEAKRYNFDKTTIVWCASGHWSRHLRYLYELARAEQKPEVPRVYRSITAEIECTVEKGIVFIRDCNDEGRGEWQNFSEQQGWPNLHEEGAEEQVREFTRAMHEAAKTDKEHFYWSCINHCALGHVPSPYWSEVGAWERQQAKQFLEKAEAYEAALLQDRPEVPA